VARFETIGVVGAGAMGRGIAQVAALAGRRVRLSDVSIEALEAGGAAIRDSVFRAMSKGRLSEAAALDALDRITVHDGLRAHAGADLVIEAATERADIKAAIFTDLAEIAPGAVLATNTSALSIGQLAQAAQVPLVGLHFFNPAHVMKLVEVVTLPETDPGLAQALSDEMTAWGKTPVICADTPGFIVNRCARPFYGEAMAILEEGTADAATIDASMLAAGYRIGPFALIDLIGADVNLAATQGVYDGMAQNPRYYPFQTLRAQVAKGALGNKAGKGFLIPPADGPAPEPAPAIAERIEATLVNEACTLLETGTATRDGIDTALRLGLNFPRGPFEMLAHHGAGRMLAMLERLARTAPPHLAGRYTPSPALLALVTD